MSKKHVIACSLRIPADLKAWIDQQAEQDKRSFNNHVVSVFSILRQQQQEQHKREHAA